MFRFISVVGEKEATNKTVNVRTRDNKVHGELTIDALLVKFNRLKTERVLQSEEMEPSSDAAPAATAEGGDK